MGRKLPAFLVLMIILSSCLVMAQDTPKEPAPSPAVSPSASPTVTPSPAPTPVPTASPSGGSRDFTSTKDLIQALANKADSIKDYTLSLFYTGKEGTFVFDYRCVRPNNIRTRIVQGQNARAVLLYLPQEKEDSLKAKKGMFKKWISIDKYKETPLVQSLLDQFLREIQQYPEGKILGTDTVTLTVGKDVMLSSAKGTVTLEPYVAQTTPSPTPEASSDPMQDPKESPAVSPTPESSAQAGGSPEPTPDKTQDESHDTKKISRECLIVQFEKDNVKDIIAIDRETLWVVFRKKLVGGKIDQEAAVWEIKENINPEISF